MTHCNMVSGIVPYFLGNNFVEYEITIHLPCRNVVKLLA